MSKKRIVVIGGSAAGPKAAAKARRLDEGADIVLLQKGRIFRWPPAATPIT